VGLNQRRRKHDGTIEKATHRAAAAGSGIRLGRDGPPRLRRQLGLLLIEPSALRIAEQVPVVKAALEPSWFCSRELTAVVREF
jgi:hypothetical protein